MSLFDFKTKSAKSNVSDIKESDTVDNKNLKAAEAPITGSKIIVSIGEEDQTLEINKGDATITIANYDLVIRRNATTSDKKYRILGIGGSLVVTEKELDHIYSEFKRYNQ